jgi:hypothetical protein
MCRTLRHLPPRTFRSSTSFRGAASLATSASRHRAWRRGFALAFKPPESMAITATAGATNVGWISIFGALRAHRPNVHQTSLSVLRQRSCFSPARRSTGGQSFRRRFIFTSPRHSTAMQQHVSFSISNETPNCSPANRRSASPLNAGRQFVRASCAPPSLSAAVVHLASEVIRQGVFKVVSHGF